MYMFAVAHVSNQLKIVLASKFVPLLQICAGCFLKQRLVGTMYDIIGTSVSVLPWRISSLLHQSFGTRSRYYVT